MTLKLSGVQLGVLTGGPSSLNLYDLADVSIVSPQTGQYLRYNAGISEWQNAYINSDVYDYLDGAMSGTQGVSLTFTPGPNTIAIGLGAITPSSVAASGTVTGSNLTGTNTGDQTITLTGDVTGSGTGTFSTTLATVNGSPQTDQFRKITVDGKGLTTATSSVTAGDITTALGYTPVNKAGDTMTGNLILNADPSVALGAATKQYVDNVSSGMNIHLACVAGTNGNLSATYNNGSGGVGATLTANPSAALPAIDGVTLSVNDRVLVKNQSSQPENGIYVVTQTTSPWILTRSSDFDNSPTGEVVAGDSTFLQEGAQAGTQWVQVTPGTITVGTTNIVFTQFGGPGTYTAGTGIDISSNIVSLATFSDGGTGTFLKLTRDSYGRVSGTSAVTTSDLTSLLSSTYQPLDSTLTALAAYNTNGILTQTGVDTFVGRAISGTVGNIVLTDGDGVSGNPTVNLATLSDGGTGTFLKLTRDSYGRVSGTAAVTSADITGLVDSTYVKIAGDTMTGTLGIISGNAGAPGLFFSGDTNTGIYSSGADTFNIATAGTISVTVDASGALTTIGGITSGGALTTTNGITQQSGYFNLYPYNGSYDDGGNCRWYWDGNNGKIVFARNGGSGTAGCTLDATGINVANINASGSLVTSGGNITITKVAPTLTLNSTTGSGDTTNIWFQSVGLNRWRIGKTTTTESGSNAGSNLFIAAYDDSGALISNAMLITRSSNAVQFTGAVTAPSFNATSTKRVKKAVKNLTQSTIDKFSKLRPREYDRKDYNAHEFGFIAEEMALVYPEVVGCDDTGKPSGIDYGKLSTILTAKIQEQQLVIEQLQTQITTIMGLLKGSK